jgi:hypothetical protein
MKTIYDAASVGRELVRPEDTSAIAGSALRSAILRDFDALPDDALVLPPVAGAYLNYSLRWLELKRHTGGGPEYVRFGGVFRKNRFGAVQMFGGRCAYRKRALVAYSAQHRSYRSTAEYDVGEKVAA